MDNITFSLMQLIEESQVSGERFILPSKNVFSNLDESFYVLIDDIYYEVIVEKKDEYIWFVFDYGKPNPLDDKLTNH